MAAAGTRAGLPKHRSPTAAQAVGLPEIRVTELDPDRRAAQKQQHTQRQSKIAGPVHHARKVEAAGCGRQRVFCYVAHRHPVWTATISHNKKAVPHRTERHCFSPDEPGVRRQASKDFPHPQDWRAFGFTILNPPPVRLSEKSTTEPRTYSALTASTSTDTPK